MPGRDPQPAIIGAGAAGLMAALWAARAGARPVLYESRRDGGRKILISGGGRCNILPSQLDPSQYTTGSSPHSLRKMLLRWPLPAQRAFFDDELGLDLQLEPGTGKLFPASNSARMVRDLLRAAAEAAGARFVGEHRLVDLRPGPGGGWALRFDGQPEQHHPAVVLATGGLSVPKTGSDGLGLQLSARLGHELIPTYAALTPLLGGGPAEHSLSGLSLEVEIDAGGAGRSRGGFLFTHGGFSGPAVLDISHHAVRALDAGQPVPPLCVHWPAGHEWGPQLENPGSRSARALARLALPQRLADYLVDNAAVDPERRFAELPRPQRERLSAQLQGWPLPVRGHEGYRKAEVTGGGVALAEVDPKDLQSRRQPGLFLCGELLDAFGPIGGYNFAWAWSTGRTAGEGIAAFTRELEA